MAPIGTRKTEPVYKTSVVSACRRVGVASSYERSELETRDRIPPSPPSFTFMLSFKKQTNLGFWAKLKKPILVMAPMADVTDFAFRQMFAKYGKPDVMWTEFVSADGLVRVPEERQEKLWSDLLYTEEERPIVAQLFSGNPKMMEQACYLVTKAGFDGIDINMGCPEKSIQKQKAGASLMKDYKLAVKIIKSAKKGIKKACKELNISDIPLSVKTRLGYNSDQLEEWLKILLKEKLAVVTIHARTKKEMSKVPAKWNRIKDAVEIRNKLKSKTLIFGNGDVKNLEDAKIKAEETGCDGVMIGRGIFGNPWFFNRALGGGERIDLKNKLEVLVEHTKLFEKYLESPRLQNRKSTLQFTTGSTQF